MIKLVLEAIKAVVEYFQSTSTWYVEFWDLHRWMKDDICTQHMIFRTLKRIDRSFLPEGEQGFSFNSIELNLPDDCCIGVSSFNHNLLKITFRSNFSSTTLLHTEEFQVWLSESNQVSWECGEKCQTWLFDTRQIQSIQSKIPGAEKGHLLTIHGW